MAVAVLLGRVHDAGRMAVKEEFWPITQRGLGLDQSKARWLRRSRMFIDPVVVTNRAPAERNVSGKQSRFAPPEQEGLSCCRFYKHVVLNGIMPTRRFSLG